VDLGIKIQTQTNSTIGKKIHKKTPHNSTKFSYQQTMKL